MKKIVAIITLTFICAAAVAQSAKKSSIQPALTTSIASSAKKISDVAINPNPVTGSNFTLELQNLENGKYSIYIFDKNGKKYLVKTLNLDEGSSTQVIDLPKDITTGTYILQVLSKTSRYSKKMVVE